MKGSPDLDPKPFLSHPSLCSLCPLWLESGNCSAFKPFGALEILQRLHELDLEALADFDE